MYNAMIKTTNVLIEIQVFNISQIIILLLWVSSIWAHVILKLKLSTLESGPYRVSCLGFHTLEESLQHWPKNNHSTITDEISKRTTVSHSEIMKNSALNCSCVVGLWTQLCPLSFVHVPKIISSPQACRWPQKVDPLNDPGIVQYINYDWSFIKKVCLGWGRMYTMFINWSTGALVRIAATAWKEWKFPCNSHSA